MRASAIEDGGVVIPFIVGPDDLEKCQNDTRKVLLCYINENSFEENNSIDRALEHALNEDIDIIMI